MKKWSNRITAVLASGILFGSLGIFYASEPVLAETSPTNSETVSVQILGINDFHGALNTTGSFYDDAGKKVEKAGTAALLAGYLNQAEKEFSDQHQGAQTIRVQSGDMVGASPASSGLLQDEPTIKVLNQMNFSIGTLGNHEFDEGLSEFNRIMTGGLPQNDPYGILSSYPREASKTEIVVGNVVKKGTADNPEIPFNWKPYTIKEVGETGKKVKIGFIGVVTTEIPNLVLKEHYTDYDFLDEAQTIAYYSSELVEQGVNAIVVLAHVPATSKNEAVSGDAADILTKVNEIYPENSVDALFAGHNHQYTNGVVNKTRVVQSTAQGKGYIDLQGEIDLQTQDFVSTPTAQVHAVDPASPTVPEKDSAVAATVKDAEDRVAAVTTKKIGTAKDNGMITREVNDSKESPLGNLITDGQVAMANAKNLNVDFAMTNNGGIRADLVVGDNKEITWGAAQAVQPFGNIMQIVEMTGDQIEQVLNEQYDEEERYFLQVSGLTYTYIKTEDENQPFKVQAMYSKDGSEILKDHVYRVVINDFLLGGGDGFAGFTKAKLINAMQPDTETFIGYIESKEAAGELIEAKTEDRKRLVDASEPEPNDEAIEKIKKATIFDPLYEDDTLLRGVTLPNMSIILFDGEMPMTKKVIADIPEGDLVGQADSKGIIKIDVTSLKIKGKKKITAVVVDEKQNSVAYSLDVLPAKLLSETKDSTTGKTKTSTSDSVPQKNTEKELPKTGEQSQTLELMGIALLSVSVVYIFRKKTKV